VPLVISSPNVETEEEEMVEVAGRRMPLRLWEAEILVRAAGWVVLMESTVVVALLAAVLVWEPKRIGALDGGFGCSLFGAPFMCLVGAGLLRRSQLARRILGMMLVGWLISTAALVAPLVGTGSPLNRLQLGPSDLFLAPLFLLPQLFLVFVILGPASMRAFREELRGTPLARLSSIRGVRHSPRAWAAYFIIWLTILSVALAILGGVGAFGGRR